MMSPKINLPIYFYDPKVQQREMKKFLKTLEIKEVNFKLIIPETSKNIYQVVIDFRYKKEWKLFIEKYWGKDYFDKHMKEKK